MRQNVFLPVFDGQSYPFTHRWKLQEQIVRQLTNVLFLTTDDGFSGIMYSLFEDRKNIFLTIFSTKFVAKCAAKILKIG